MPFEHSIVVSVLRPVPWPLIWKSKMLNAFRERPWNTPLQFKLSDRLKAQDNDERERTAAFASSDYPRRDFNVECRALDRSIDAIVASIDRLELTEIRLKEDLDLSRAMLERWHQVHARLSGTDLEVVTETADPMKQRKMIETDNARLLADINRLRAVTAVLIDEVDRARADRALLLALME